ncbi:hypothetical protein [Nostoc linckia]|uniref:hypothetical protein n=1 Tax=Nostoc linckia TaxID=92942 RepID=UPI0015D4A97E|nr:hypothetical protein [Nostoc linckia]
MRQSYHSYSNFQVNKPHCKGVGYGRSPLPGIVVQIDEILRQQLTVNRQQSTVINLH